MHNQIQSVLYQYQHQFPVGDTSRSPVWERLADLYGYRRSDKENEAQQSSIAWEQPYQARDIDIDTLAHVINYELPSVSKNICPQHCQDGAVSNGRRMEISFCDTKERTYPKYIQKLTGFNIPIMHYIAKTFQSIRES